MRVHPMRPAPPYYPESTLQSVHSSNHREMSTRCPA